MKHTPIFNAVRQMLGRGFRQAEVDALNRALGEAFSSPQGHVPCVLSCRIGEQGIALIKRFEGCAKLRKDRLVEAYPDPGTGGDPWTIGWGATGRGLDGQGRIGPGTVWTRAECDARLERDLKRFTSEVAQILGDAPTTQAQFDALVSFHYNTGAIARATLTRRHLEGKHGEAVREFSAGTKPVAGC